MAKGYIYIFTNPSFKEYIKIGYAKDVNQRLADLNRSTAVPLAFRVYATYEVDSALSDKKLHSILDKLNPDLRSVETVNGKTRVREFYAMPPEDAYDILEAIAEINGYSSRLKKWEASESEKKDEEIANTIKAVHLERAAPFTFSMCKISTGSEIEFWPDSETPSGKFAVVVDEKHVEYNGIIYSLTGLAKFLLDKPSAALAGPAFFKYNGEWLNDIRAKNK